MTLSDIQKLIGNVKHMVLATVNEDGSPHNTPLFCIRSSDLSQWYWVSSSDSLHSLNIERTRQGFIIVFDSVTGKQGLYVKLINARVAEGKVLDRAVVTFNKALARNGKPPVDKKRYQGTASQRMYVADAEKFWLNEFSRDSSGRIAQDFRVPVVL